MLSLLLKHPESPCHHGSVIHPRTNTMTRTRLERPVVKVQLENKKWCRNPDSWSYLDDMKLPTMLLWLSCCFIESDRVGKWGVLKLNQPLVQKLESELFFLFLFYQRRIQFAICKLKIKNSFLNSLTCTFKMIIYSFYCLKQRWCKSTRSEGFLLHQRRCDATWKTC